MKIRVPIVVDPAKLTQYLLVYGGENDKSGCLSGLGYSLENWQELEADIRKLRLRTKPFFKALPK